MNLATLSHNIWTTLLGNTNRNTRRKAIQSALASVTNTNPDYANIGFDEHFMKNGGASLMEPFLNGGELPTPDELTSVWADQFPYANESRQRAIANITPMVIDFVELLASQVESAPDIVLPVAFPTQPYYVEMSGQARV